MRISGPVPPQRLTSEGGKNLFLIKMDVRMVLSHEL